MTAIPKLKLGISSLSSIILLGCLVVGGLGLKAAMAQEAAPAAPAVASPASDGASGKYLSAGFDYLAIGLAVGLACLGAGYAVGKVGSAALGAVVEKPELMGRALIFVGLAEGIAIYGLIFGILLLRQL